MTQQERTTSHLPHLTPNHHQRFEHESGFDGLSAIDGMGQAPSDVKSQLSYDQLVGDHHGFTREENVNHFQRKQTIMAKRNPVNRKPDVASGVVSIRIDPPRAAPVV